MNLSGKHYGSTNRPQVSVEDDSDRDRSNQDDPESLGGPYPTRTSASSPRAVIGAFSGAILRALSDENGVGSYTHL